MSWLAIGVITLAGKYGIEACRPAAANKLKTMKISSSELARQVSGAKHPKLELSSCTWSVAPEKVNEAPCQVMQANHPDAGGSDYLASKINEVKGHLLA
ncbi:hypothetical protein CY35_03G139700 [Sphagnum magellanicum]|nr:hypothetical protein CY35_03G139700 [Sphagnum magellanicum]